MGKTMNGDTPNRIEELVRESFWMAATRTQGQGRMLRMLEKVNIKAETTISTSYTMENSMSMWTTYQS
jgi:hypothetical protein